MNVPHDCEYREGVAWGEWSIEGDLRIRRARRVPVCASCGRERPARRTRPVILEEVEATCPRPPGLIDPSGRAVANALLASTGDTFHSRGLLGRLRGRGLPASAVESWLDEFLRAGWLRIQRRTRGTRTELKELCVLNRQAIEEAARPGAAQARAVAEREAMRVVGHASHPLALEARRWLLEDRDLPPELIRALAAVVAHADAGDILSERVFSTRYLGDSKALDRVRRRLESMIGSLAQFGIREGAAVTLVGGKGTIHSGEAVLRIEDFLPFVGLSRETVTSCRVEFPSEGLFAIENLAAFEAACRGEVKGVPEALIVWSAGYPGRSVRALVEAAAAAGRPIRAWADLDLDGIRIARLIGSWAGGRFEAFRMCPADVERAPAHRPLPPADAAAIRRDLADHPNAPLAKTLQALLSANYQVEQEAFLGK